MCEIFYIQWISMAFTYPHQKMQVNEVNHEKIAQEKKLTSLLNSRIYRITVTGKYMKLYQVRP